MEVMVMVIIVLFLLFALSASGGGAWWWYTKSSSDSLQPPVTTASTTSPDTEWDLASHTLEKPAEGFCTEDPNATLVDISDADCPSYLGARFCYNDNVHNEGIWWSGFSADSDWPAGNANIQTCPKLEHALTKEKGWSKSKPTFGLLPKVRDTWCNHAEAVKLDTSVNCPHIGTRFCMDFDTDLSSPAFGFDKDGGSDLPHHWSKADPSVCHGLEEELKNVYGWDGTLPA